MFSDVKVKVNVIIIMNYERPNANRERFNKIQFNKVCKNNRVLITWVRKGKTVEISENSPLNEVY